MSGHPPRHLRDNFELLEGEARARKVGPRRLFIARP